MGRTTASGFVIGRGTVSDLSQESSHEGLLLLRLWACGQGGRVVQAKRHVHSPRVENAARATLPWAPARPEPDAAGGCCRRQSTRRCRPAPHGHPHSPLDLSLTHISLG